MSFSKRLGPLRTFLVQVLLLVLFASPSDAAQNELIPAKNENGVLVGASETARAREAIDAGRLGNLKLEVVFVIDTTRGNAALIDCAKKVAKRVDVALGDVPMMRDSVKFGLVQYRDSTPRHEFVAKMETKLTDIRTFRKSLESLTAAKCSSKETKEDVLAGLLMAIEKSGWSEKSSKHIILLGDASAHVGNCNSANPNVGCKYVRPDGTCEKNTTGLDVRKLISKAQRRHGEVVKQELASINFHAVHAKNAEDPGDETECIAQFQELSQNAGRLQGHFASFDPNVERDKHEVIGGLSRRLITAFGDLARVHAGHANSTVPAYSGRKADAARKDLIPVKDESGEPIGIHRKVVVRTDSAMLYCKPGGGTTEAIKPFSIFFRLLTPDGQEQQGDWVRVGNNDGAADGWIEAKNLFDWDTRFVLKLNAVHDDDGGSMDLIAPVLEELTVGAKREYRVALFGASPRTVRFRLRGPNGELLAHPAVLVDEDDLLRLHATLFLVHEALKAPAGPAGRRRVGALIKTLQEVLTRALIGEDVEIESAISLAKLMAYLPLKTDTLKLTPKDIAIMNEREFVTWLGALESARKRVEDLLVREQSAALFLRDKAANKKCMLVPLEDLP